MKSGKNFVVVSNRLPIEVVRKKSSEFEIRPGSGGLASALSGVQETTPFRWMGSVPGIREKDQEKVSRSVSEAGDYHSLFLPDDIYRKYYDGFSNQCLWPLFHYMPGKFEFSSEHWAAYREVNERFAAELAKTLETGARVWIHDYHLMLLPRMLRNLRPDLKIAFFLHIPFPSSEIFRLLPVRQEILEGLLGSDLVGFHTYDYSRHFVTSCRRILGADSHYDLVTSGDRTARVGAYPIGINPEQFLRSLKSEDYQNYVENLKSTYAGKKILLGVDRLDYTKGIPEKLRALARLLELHPELKDQLVFVQIGIPSRDRVEDYVKLKREVDRLVGEINGKFGSVAHQPIHYVTRSISRDELSALYSAADILIVSSTRDGMNLVSFEYSLFRSEKPGVLVLSEFTGASQIFPEALLVNPWDIEGMAKTLWDALQMEDEERARKSKQNRDLVFEYTSIEWSQRMIADLDRAMKAEPGSPKELSEEMNLFRQHYEESQRRALFLDYDGTLTEIVERPHFAIPSPELKALLRDTSEDSKNQVYILSGRSAKDLEKWFGDLKGINLVAEHGFLYRDRNSDIWRKTIPFSTKWKSRVRAIMEDFVRRAPHSFLEEKEACLVWHYREVEPSLGERMAYELNVHLEESLANDPVEVILGKRIVEVRSVGANKGTFLGLKLSGFKESESPGFVLCAGDDRTDEEMFLAAPKTAWSLKVGDEPSAARFSVTSPKEFRNILSSLV